MVLPFCIDIISITSGIYLEALLAYFEINSAIAAFFVTFLCQINEKY